MARKELIIDGIVIIVISLRMDLPFEFLYYPKHKGAYVELDLHRHISPPHRTVYVEIT